MKKITLEQITLALDEIGAPVHLAYEDIMIEHRHHNSPKTQHPGGLGR